MSGALVLAAALTYLIGLFAIAFYADKRDAEGRSLVTSPLVYSLSIAVYCTSWTFYGSVGRAAQTGLGFLPIYLGPTLVFILGWIVLRKILSICKGGAEFRLALQHFREQLPLEKISVWFNVSGAVHGHDLINLMTRTRMGRLRTRVVCASIGADWRGIEQLRSEHAFFQKPLKLPDKLKVVSVFGVPLLHHLQPYLVPKFNRLKALGPNDGMLLLSNLNIRSGWIYPIWGADHFMRDSRIVPLWYRFFGLMQKHAALENRHFERSY